MVPLFGLGDEGGVDVGVAAGEIELFLPDYEPVFPDDDLVISRRQDNRGGGRMAE